MSSASQQFNTTLSMAEVEALIQRAVREAVHAEFAHFIQQLPASIAQDWSHEGADDPAGDQLLLAEGLAERDRYRTSHEPWQNWDDFKAELAAAEAAG